MAHDTIKHALGVLRQIWHASRAFFFSIELWLMVLVAYVTVGGVWPAFMGELTCLVCFGGVTAYLVARVVLHIKRIVRWPFLCGGDA